MPQVESWSRLPAALRAHVLERRHDRNIKLCGDGKYPKTFLLEGQPAVGKKL